MSRVSGMTTTGAIAHGGVTDRSYGQPDAPCATPGIKGRRRSETIMEPAAARTGDAILPDDAGLVRRARDGDVHAFDAIAASRLPGAYQLASAILGAEAPAAKATQNALLIAWAELPRLDAVERFEPWFLRILIGQCRTQGHRQSLVTSPGPGDAGPDASTMRFDVGSFDGSTDPPDAALDVLEPAFAALDADDRTMLVLHRWMGWPAGKIATVLDLPVATVSWRLDDAGGRLHLALRSVE
jgi:RNA polymerase sigma-70 factor (ECF subfamily)